MTVRRWAAHPIATIIAVLGVAALGGGVAWAVISPVSGGVIHSCYNPATGGLQLKVTTNCPASGNKTPLNWNVQGPKGNTGPQGPAAPAHVEDVTWNATVGQNAAAGSVKTSTTFGVGASVLGLTGKLTGDFGTCTGGFIVEVRIGSSQANDVLVWNHSGSAGVFVSNMAPTSQLPVSITSGAAQPLEVGAVTCYLVGFVPTTPPAIQISATVHWTHPLPARTIT